VARQQRTPRRWGVVRPAGSRRPSETSSLLPREESAAPRPGGRAFRLSRCGARRPSGRRDPHPNAGGARTPCASARASASATCAPRVCRLPGSRRCGRANHRALGTARAEHEAAEQSPAAGRPKRAAVRTRSGAVAKCVCWPGDIVLSPRRRRPSSSKARSLREAGRTHVDGKTRPTIA